MAFSEITPSAVKIDKLIHRIEEGDIKIPAFQRGFVWDQEQIISLLDSIYKDYPIGSILLWQSNEVLKATRNIGGFKLPERSDDYPVNYVLDGQQRISTIYAVFCKDRTQIDEDNDSKVKPEMFDIYFDLVDKTFLPADNLIEGHTTMRLNDLFNQSFLLWLGTLSKDEQELATKVHSQFNNYEVPNITISKRSKDEVGTIFERINNTGTDLTTLDLMVAWTWNEDFHLRKKIRELLDDLESKGFGDLPEKILLQCLSGIIKQSTTTSTILSLTSQEVQENFDLLDKSIKKAIDYLSTQLHIESRDFLPHVQQLIGLSYFFSKLHTPTVEQTRTLQKWFWRTSFSRRYSAQTDEKMNADVSFMNKVLGNDMSGLGNYKHTLTDEQLTTQKFTKTNPIVRAFLVLLAQKNPLNLINGDKIDLADTLSRYNSREYHHVFPRAYLKGIGITDARLNAIANFCFLPADANKKISDREPADYIFNLIPDNIRLNNLESNALPVDVEIFRNNDFETFLNKRAKLILAFLENELS